MIKFVIGLIALIFVALAVYTYTNKKVEVVTKSAVTDKVKKTEVTELKVKELGEVAKEVQRKVQSKKVDKLNSKVSDKRKSLVTQDEKKKVVVDEYGISHPSYNVDEERILLEINGKAKIQLDEDTIHKIELEIKNSIF